MSPSVCCALADRSAQEIRFGLAATLLALVSGYGLPRLARLMSDIAAARECHHLDIGLELQQRDEGGPDHVLVFGQQYFDH